MKAILAILAAGIAVSAFADAPNVLELLPDGNGGATAFAFAGNKIVAIPIDATGTPRPERAADVWRDLPRFWTFGIGKTTAGSMMSFSDAAPNAWLAPLRDDFSSLGPQLYAGGDWPVSLTCNGDLCAVRLWRKGTLLIVDDKANRVAELPMPQFSAIAGTNDGGFAVAFGQSVAFIDHAGRITATSVVASGGVVEALAPHPLGAAAFWRDGTRVIGAVVRRDGTIAAQTAIDMPDLQVWAMRADDGGGEVALMVDTLVKPWIGPPAPFSGPPVLAAYALRLSESLTPLDAPVKLAPGMASSGLIRIAFSGNAFFAAWWEQPESFGRHARVLRVPLAGPIDPSASTLVKYGPITRRRP